MSPRSFRHLPGSAPALATLALVTLAVLAMGSSCSRDFPTGIHATAITAPPPSSAAGVVELLRWCWNNRDLPHYQEVFSNDFQFAFAATDSAGTPYHAVFSREDMLICAQHLFVGGGARPPATSISLIFNGDLTAQPDFRPGKEWPWHQQVQITSLTLTVDFSDGSAVRVTGGALFYLVRGDSAEIPVDLLARGIKPDSTRWFIGRWEDQTNIGAASAAPAHPLPAERFTWGRLLALYR